MPLDELIEKEAKRFAKEAAKTVKSAMRIGKQMIEIFIDEMSKDMKDELKGKKKEEDPSIPIQ